MHAILTTTLPRFLLEQKKQLANMFSKFVHQMKIPLGETGCSGKSLGYTGQY